MEAIKNAASKLLDFRSEDLALPKGSLILVTGASGKQDLDRVDLFAAAIETPCELRA